ncbi:ICP22 family protein [Streptomonospora litoralis]|uniref:Uncharacterized protein n=1 Tax=Streptomonospora litoralis TaxID=2498135 RepID=A0A4P6Q287_9ACTN|nr:hypothetical protein [Streptomonospora litoralis]QBI54746.1 hypothetical protein EKD16_14830 [Streptomonospora litoralis]
MTDEEDAGGRKRLDLSASQVVGGGVATMTAATAASYLGVYGTIIGAAVMSVISTAGTAVFSHWMQQGGRKARGLAGRQAGRTHREDSARGTLAHSGPGAGDGDTLLAAASEPGADGEQQRDEAPAGSVEETRALPLLGADGPAEADERAHHAEEQPGGDEARRPRWRPAWPGWRRLALPAAAVFLGVMGVVLVFELFTGQSLSDTVHGRQTASAPTILGGGSTGGEQEGDEPAPEATPTGGTRQDGGPAGDPSAPVEQQPEEGATGAPQQPETGTDGQDTEQEETSAPQEDTGDTGDTGEQEPGTEPGGGSGPGGQGGVVEPGRPSP